MFEHLQREQIVRIKLEAVSLDSTIVKVHPDGTGALKKTDPSPSAWPGEVETTKIHGGCRASAATAMNLGGLNSPRDLPTMRLEGRFF